MIHSIKLIALKDIRPTEETLPKRLKQIRSTILRTGKWTSPIVIESQSMAIMDGHHRYHCAKEFGFEFIPCLIMSYDQVKVESRNKEVCVTPSEIIHRALCGNLYPPKSTHHTFANILPACEYSFKKLKRQSNWDNHCSEIWHKYESPTDQSLATVR